YLGEQIGAERVRAHMVEDMHDRGLSRFTAAHQALRLVSHHARGPLRRKLVDISAFIGDTLADLSQVQPGQAQVAKSVAAVTYSAFLTQRLVELDSHLLKLAVHPAGALRESELTPLLRPHEARDLTEVLGEAITNATKYA